MNNDVSSKIKGALYGFAIGDAMGATTEFMSPSQIAQVYDRVENIIGGGWLRLEPGQVTDDTAMMLCVAEGHQASVTNGTEFAAEVANRFIAWLKTNPVDVGMSCRAGIERLAEGKWAIYDRNALGNGALMRALPMALVDRMAYNFIQADMTHCNPIQHHMIECYQRLVVCALYRNNCEKGLDWYLASIADRDQEDLRLPTGHVENTMYNAVWWNKMAHDFEGVILGAVNGGGDADTIAAIAGSLAGIKYGYQNVPQRWIDQLDSGVKCRLDAAADFITNCCLTRHPGV